MCTNTCLFILTSKIYYYIVWSCGTAGSVYSRAISILFGFNIFNLTIYTQVHLLWGRWGRGRDRMVVGFSNYLCNQCLSPLTLWVRTPIRRGVLDSTLCDKVCQWLATGWWFSPSTPVSSTNKLTACTVFTLKMFLYISIVSIWIHCLMYYICNKTITNGWFMVIYAVYGPGCHPQNSTWSMRSWGPYTILCRWQTGP
jgi:hypothetical protein